MEYKIVSSEDVDSLARQVNLLIEANWKPQGGISSTLRNGTMYPIMGFYQAMVKE